MSTTYRAYTAVQPRGQLVEKEYQWDELDAEEVEMDVLHCGICRSDISLIDNDWGLSQYPFIPGHEAIGRITKMGPAVKGLQLGQIVGVGFLSKSCACCQSCLNGDYNLCAKIQWTVQSKNGGFAEKLRCHWLWAIPLPQGLDVKTAGPLFCGGITVFNPLIQHDIKATHRVGVIGLGGLGHLAIQFLNKWGCDVTAFCAADTKAEDALSFGADHVVNSRDNHAVKRVAGSLDFILSTVHADLEWSLYLNALGPRGIFHTVGMIPSPMQIHAFSLIAGQKTVSGSPVGSPATIKTMLDFCVLHHIQPKVETFAFSDINEGLDHLRAGKARYRVVLSR